MDPITIDTTVTFTLAAGKDGKPRVAVVEAGELSDLTTLLWETKTAKDETTGKDILPWPVIEEAVTVSERVGSVEDAPAEPVAIVPPAASRALAVTASRVSRFIDDLQGVGVGKRESGRRI